MAVAIFYCANPPASTNTTLFTVTAGKDSSFNLNLCNQGATPARVRVAFAVADTPLTAEYLEYNVILPENGGVLERSGNMLPGGKKIVVWTDSASVSVIAQGVEK